MTSKTQYIEITDALSYDNDTKYELIDTDGVHTACAWTHYRAADWLLAMGYTPVLAGLTEAGDVWTVVQK